MWCPRSVAGLQYRGCGRPLFSQQDTGLPNLFLSTLCSLVLQGLRKGDPSETEPWGEPFDLCQTGNGALVKLFAAAFAAFRADFDQIIGLCEEIRGCAR